MSKLVNLEVVTLEDGYVVLEDEDGGVLEMDSKHLPENLKEGRFLRFVISHTDYDPDKEPPDKYLRGEKVDSEKRMTPNGKQLSY